MFKGLSDGDDAHDQNAFCPLNELYESLTGTQKCAILMMLLGEDEASEILKVEASTGNQLHVVMSILEIS